MSITELAIGGMTCASCAARIEKKLNKLDGVTATVNYATETARVSFPDAVAVADLISVVEGAGYSAAAEAPEPGEPDRDGLRLAVALALALPVATFSMAVKFPGWEWVALALATPVATWAAWPFHRAAVSTAAHGAATMDTLVSVGVAAAYLWSLYAVLSGSGDTYLEVASVVTALVLLGRHLEARAKRSAGAALRALLSSGAQEATVLRDGRELRIPVGELAIGEEFVVRPGEKIAADGAVVAGSSAVDTSMLTGEPVPVAVGPADAVTGGCVNVDGRLLVRATAVGADTQLAHMARLVAARSSGC